MCCKMLDKPTGQYSHNTNNTSKVLVWHHNTNQKMTRVQNGKIIKNKPEIWQLVFYQFRSVQVVVPSWTFHYNYLIYPGV